MNSWLVLANRELGIGLVAYSPLGRGFFGGKAVESSPPNSLLVKTFLSNFFLVLAIII